jgi:hypothetical protein
MRLGGPELPDCVEGGWTETGTTQGNIPDWLQLDEGDPGRELLTGRNCYCTKKLGGLSPRANYTDRATAACRRS